LSDGSFVWLKGNSRLSFPSQFEGLERRVKLEGEALFEISKVSSKPNIFQALLGEKPQRKSFIVESGEIRTKVLGTSFNIKIDSLSTDVFVLTGKVAVHTDNTENIVEVRPKEKVVFDHQAKKLSKKETKTST